jgi:hypothetical protein
MLALTSNPPPALMLHAARFWVPPQAQIVKDAGNTNGLYLNCKPALATSNASN